MYRKTGKFVLITIAPDIKESSFYLVDIGAIFLCRFRLYVLSFMFRFMFANICFEKNENSKIYVTLIINIT